MTALAPCIYADTGSRGPCYDPSCPQHAKPRRSGTATTGNAGRKRKMVMLTLSPEAIARLGELAAESSRSAVVERLIRRARLPRP